MYGNECSTRVCGSGNEISYARALANWAQVELLKEKVKARMEKHYGEKLEKVADLIVDIVAEKAKNEKEWQKSREELHEAMEKLEGEN